MGEPVRLQMTIWLRISCYISKTTHAQAHARPCAPTHSPPSTHTRARARAYVMLIALLRQQWFLERASVLRYTHIACPVFGLFNCAVLCADYVALMYQVYLLPERPAVKPCRHWWELGWTKWHWGQVFIRVLRIPFRHYHSTNASYSSTHSFCYMTSTTGSVLETAHLKVVQLQ